MNMKSMTLSEIAVAVGGRLVNAADAEQSTITQVVMDSRQDVTGALFVAIAGQRVDGHDFVADVLARGAVCALAEREIAGTSGAYILVDSTLRAIRDLAAYYRGLFSIPVIGITGSVGKTSTKEMISATLGVKFDVLKTEGNLNNEIGVPMTLFRLREHHQAAVIEMGISDFGEMTRLTEMVRPDIAIITIIGYAHLDNLGDRNGVLRAKTEIFKGLPPQGIALVSGDDDLLRPSAITDFVPHQTKVRKIIYGMSGGNDYRAVDITSQGTDKTDTSCTLLWGDTALDVTIPSFGVAAVYAALAAAAVGDMLGLTGDEIRRGIAGFSNVSGRVTVHKTPRFIVIDDCYNANPSSVTASVTSLSELTGRRVAILGDMAELGPDEAKLHYEIGAYIAAAGLDLTLCVGTLSRHTYQGVLDASDVNTQHFAAKADLLAVLPNLVQDGDQILVKASRSRQFEEIVAALQTM